MHTNIRNTLISLAALTSIVLASCGGVPLVPPETLRVPASITCISLPDTLSFTITNESGGRWPASLRSGLYIAERENDQGVFYRAPTGGFTLMPGSTTARSMDGGFWLPHDPKSEPLLYNMTAVDPVAPLPAGSQPDCSKTSYTKDPSSGKISIVADTSRAALAGAVGGAAGRAAVPGSGVSYGQAAVGGAIGTGVVALILSANSGKIRLWPATADTQFIEKLRERAATAAPVPIQKASAPTIAPTADNK